MKTKLELIKNYPIESLKNWGEYYGYPENICKEMLDMVDYDWQNTKIAVLDDFGFQMINFLIKVKNVPLRNIYFLVSEEDEAKVESMKKWYSNFVENEILQYYNINNMSFDLIIANPPYGKASSLSKKIVNTLLENKVAKEMIVLAPPKTFYGVLDYSKGLKCVSSYLNKTFVFEDASVEILFLDHIVSEKQNKYKEPSEFLLDEKHKLFRNAVIEYNKTHSNGLEYKSWTCTLQKKEKGLFDDLEDSKIFLVPIYTPSPLNGVARQGESHEHNVLRKPIEYRKRASAPYILYIKDDVHYNNFSNWWYSAKKRREGGLINFMFDILFVLYGGGPSLLKYTEVIPHLDWSHPWTDKEILKEIGLPEDFLEEK